MQASEVLPHQPCSEHSYTTLESSGIVLLHHLVLHLTPLTLCIALVDVRLGHNSHGDPFHEALHIVLKRI